MMTRIINYLALSFCFIGLACSSDKANGVAELEELNFPNYEKVVDHFYQTYSTRNNEPGEILHFEKKPTGWHVSIMDHNQNAEEVFNAVFWDIETEDYVEMDLPLRDEDEDQSQEIAQCMVPWFERNFELYPYYGYPGWDDDVIGRFENQSNLSDSSLNALARAYRVHASNLLSKNAGLVAEGVTYDLPMTANSMNEEQLTNYRKYAYLSIETYEKLVKQNPDFPVLVGAVETKLANEFVTSFLDIRVYQNEEEAKQELKEGIYSDAIVSMAKNYLTSCAENAILFTSGDNDTYPLLYVQSQLGFRQDVLVINLSLLNTERYINHLRKDILTAEAAPFSIIPSEVEGDLRSYLYVKDDDLLEMEVSEALDFILDKENSVSDYNGIPLYQIPTRNLKLTSGEDQMSFSYNSPYLYRSGLMALDIIATNQNDRPIYFSNGSVSQSYMGLDAYLRNVGIVSVLGTVESTHQIHGVLQVDKDELYDNLMNGYDFSGVNEIHKEDERLLSSYGMMFHQLSASLLESGEIEKAQSVLKKYLNVIPEERAYMDYLILEIAKDLYKAGMNEQAKNLVNELRTSAPTLLDGNTRKKLEEDEVILIMSNLDEIEAAFN